MYSLFLLRDAPKDCTLLECRVLLLMLISFIIYPYEVFLFYSCTYRLKSMAAPGSSMLYSFLLFVAVLSLQEMYRGKLASSELFTILGGFSSSLIFLLLLTVCHRSLDWLPFCYSFEDVYVVIRMMSLFVVSLSIWVKIYIERPGSPDQNLLFVVVSTTFRPNCVQDVALYSFLDVPMRVDPFFLEKSIKCVSTF